MISQDSIMRALSYCKVKYLHRIYHKSRNKQRIFLVGTPLHQNLGDQAITVAEFAFFKKYFPEYYVIEIPSPLYMKNKPYLIEYVKPDDIFFCNGGGNLGNVYMDEERLRRDVIATFLNNRIIILPQTMYFTHTEEGKKEIVISRDIYKLHDKLTIIAREKVTYNLMKAVFTNNTLLLIPDIVMTLDIPNKNKKRSGALLCLRSDIESALSDVQKQYINDRFKSKSLSVTKIDTVSDRWYLPKERGKAVYEKLEQIGKAKLIITDRLHGMIFAAITSTPCIAIGNYNHKLVASFEWLKHLNYLCLNDNLANIDQDIERMLKIRNSKYNSTPMKHYLDVIADYVRKNISHMNETLSVKMGESLNRPFLNLNTCPEICKHCTSPDRVFNLNSDIYSYDNFPSTLSFVIVTGAKRLNELNELLDSIKPLCDESVVILDNENVEIYNSVLKHVDVVKVSSGKGVFEAYVEDMFKYCSKEWIFRIDDDETLDNSWTRGNLQKYISDRSATSYWIPRKWFIAKDKYINVIPWLPDYQLRLFRNLPGIIKMPKQIHEPLEVYGETRRIDNHFIEHWDLFLNDKNIRKKKVARYNNLKPNNGCDIFYLYEDYKYDVQNNDIIDSNEFKVEDNYAFAIKSLQVPVVMKLDLQYVAITEINNNSSISLFPISGYIENMNNNTFISYHWYKKDKVIYKWDNERIALPNYLRSNENINVILPVKAPPEAGEYYIQIDIVEEGVKWYSREENGLYSPPIKVRIQ